MKFRPTLRDSNFTNGLNLIFELYDKDHNLLDTINATEWGNTGCYYVDTGNIRFRDLPILVVAKTNTGQKIDSAFLDTNSPYKI